MILGSYTYGKWIEDVRSELGSFDDNLAPMRKIFNAINDAVTDYHLLCGLLDNPKYREKYTLTTHTGQDEVDISALEDFKLIKEFTSVNDALNGPCREKDEDVFNQIAKYARNNALSDWAKEIIYYVGGETMYFCKGNLSAYGARTAMAIRKPRINTDYDRTAVVDVLDEHKMGVMGMIVKRLAPIVKTPIPQWVDDAVMKLPAKKQEKAVTEEKFEVKNK